MVRIEAVIDDRLWPRLNLLITRHNLDGTKTSLTQSIQYDQAYAKFENDFHNILRPAVDQLVQRRTK